MMNGVISHNGEAVAQLQADNSLSYQSEDSQPKIGEATRIAMALLGRMVRMEIADGRRILGRFHCFDKQRNVILTEAREFTPKVLDDDSSEMSSRNLGMTLVPGKHLVSMHVQPMQESNTA